MCIAISDIDALVSHTVGNRNRRKAKGDAHRNCELHVEPPDHAAVEQERHVARECDERRCDDRARELVHAAEGGVTRGKSVALDQRLAVLGYHDGVVAQGADHEDKPQHREEVDGIPECEHDR